MNSISDVLKLHYHITVLWYFCRISVTSEFSFLGIGFKTKTQKLQKPLIQKFYFLKLYQMSFYIYVSLFLVVDNAVTLVNCLFSDFRHFRCFDLAEVKKL